MNNIVYTTENSLSLTELLHIYNDVGWTAYTNKPEILAAAIKQSLCVITARHNGNLIGMIRAIGDGLTVIFIQDLLVLKAFQNQKIGTTLIQLLFNKYKHVRQKALMTDDTIKTRSFYKSLGFTACDNGKTIAFYRDELEQSSS